MLFAILAWMIIKDYHMLALILYSFVIMLSLFKHYVNFKRIYNHTETKITEAFSGQKSE